MGRYLAERAKQADVVYLQHRSVWCQVRSQSLLYIHGVDQVHWNIKRQKMQKVVFNFSFFCNWRSGDWKLIKGCPGFFTGWYNTSYFGSDYGPMDKGVSLALSDDSVDCLAPTGKVNSTFDYFLFDIKSKRSRFTSIVYDLCHVSCSSKFTLSCALDVQKIRSSEWTWQAKSMHASCAS